MFALGLTDLDLLDLGEILIAEDENNVAGFPTPFFKSLQFFLNDSLRIVHIGPGVPDQLWRLQ